MRSWTQSPALRSWPALLFVALVAVPPAGLVVLGPNPTMTSVRDASWLLAAYFAIAWRSRLAPVDYLFLGAVSGLVFGASEVVHYFTSGAGAGEGAGILVLSYVWRFLTDPISHACWSGLTGYFIGLAASGQRRWYQAGWIGLAIAMVLHGLNDWDVINGHAAWVVVAAVSGMLFLAYAKAAPAPAARPGPVQPATPTQPVAAAPGAGAQPPFPRSGPPGAAHPSFSPRSSPPSAGGTGGWWQETAPHPVTATETQETEQKTVIRKKRKKPWWEE